MPSSTENFSAPLRPTHSEKDSKGEWLGFEGRLALYPIGTLFGGIMLFSVLYSFHGWPLIPTAPVCLIPGLFVSFVILKLVNKKPPGYLVDWLDTQLGRAHLEFRRPTTRHPLADE